MPTDRICSECAAPLPPQAPGGLCPQCLLKVALGTQAPSRPGATGTSALPDTARLAEYFPQLEILEFLGKGGMGAVYKARQPSLDRLVALKVLPCSSSADPGFAERFNREARALAKLNHPNIVAVYDFGQTHGLHYLLMEFVDGASLRQVEQEGRLAPRQALQVIQQICEALQFAHDEGVVHRDIKPENVLLDKKGRVKIADFGLARILGCEPAQWRLTGARDVMGTPHYMAPEQVEHPQAVDHRADIYSLGVVFYEMLTGELPLGKFAPPSRKAPVDIRLDEVVLHALEKEPQQRYQHASEVRCDVETIASGKTRPRFSHSTSWKLARLVAAVGILLLGFGAGAWFLSRFVSAPSGAVPLERHSSLNPGRAGQADLEKVKTELAAAAASVPPVVIQTIPASGDAEVDPGLTELRVTFSKPMRDGSWSWTPYGETHYPEVASAIHFLPDRRTCVMPVKLQPGKLYATWLNSETAEEFKDIQGQPAFPYLLIFRTRL